jgi:HEAT repeat protein
MLSENLNRLRETICSQWLDAVKQKIIGCGDREERRAFFETFINHEGAYASVTIEMFALLTADEDEMIRTRSIIELARQRDPRAIPALIQALATSDDVITPGQAIALLAPFHTPEVSRALIAAFEHPTGDIVTKALELLSQRKDAATIALLIRCRIMLPINTRRRWVLNDDQKGEFLGSYLDRMIENLGTRIIEPCTECFTDAEAAIRIYCVRLVGSQNSYSAIHALLTALETGPDDVVGEAQKCLSSAYDLRAVPVLMRIAENVERPTAQAAARRILGLYFTNKVSAEAVLTIDEMTPEQRCRILSELQNRGKLEAAGVVAYCNRYLRDHPNCRGAQDVIAHQSHLRPASGNGSATPPAEMVRPSEESESQLRPFWHR